MATIALLRSYVSVSFLSLGKTVVTFSPMNFRVWWATFFCPPFFFLWNFMLLEIERMIFSSPLIESIISSKHSNIFASIFASQGLWRVRPDALGHPNEVNSPFLQNIWNWPSLTPWSLIFLHNAYFSLNDYLIQQTDVVKLLSKFFCKYCEAKFSMSFPYILFQNVNGLLHRSFHQCQSSKTTMAEAKDVIRLFLERSSCPIFWLFLPLPCHCYFYCPFFLMINFQRLR